MSADIRGLFCATCEQVGIRWTQSNHRNISVSHRHSVALLDEHVGPEDVTYDARHRAGVVELADTPALGAGAARRGGSSPSARIQ